MIRDGTETEIPGDHVQVGDQTVIRPGEKIPCDGTASAGELEALRGKVIGAAAVDGLGR